MEHFKRTGVMPHPEDLARIPTDWEDAVFLTMELYQFQLDGIPDSQPTPK